MFDEIPDLNEMEPIIVELEFEDDTKGKYEIISMFEYDGGMYAALQPADTPDDAEEVELMLMEMQDYEYNDLTGDLNFELENIEDDRLMEEVQDYFEKLLEESEE